MKDVPLYKLYIKENQFIIKINDKLNNLNIETLLDLYCILISFNILEKKNGNEYETAQIKLQYIQNTLITEYINIFKLVRTPLLFDFLKYFQTFEETFNTQNTETKININDYLENIENISQEITIKMVFYIKATINDIKKNKNIWKQSFGNIDRNILNVKK